MSEAPQKDDPQPWRCGEPYRYPLPSEKGNPWETLLDSLLEQDRTQCDAWNDEVQNLLIFAGLFSAVLTAFVIESYKALQPDPNDQIITLLAQISANTQGPPGNLSQALPSRPALADAFTPSESSIRINAFWFTSLVLSITTALIGIVSLQWIREHKKYPGRISPRDKFALLNMRNEAMKRWYVPEIFSTLPLLLQLALLLFLAGLVDFILPFGTKVATPVIVIAGCPVLFLAFTTILPGLQVFAFLAPISNADKDVPAQCPYKSPQSYVFRRLISLSERLFPAYNALARVIHFVFSDLPARAVKIFSGEYVGPQRTVRQGSISRFISKAWNSKGWMDYDLHWLALRDAYAKCIVHGKAGVGAVDQSQSARVGPVYDATRGLQSISSSNADGRATLVYTLYQCISELSSVIVSKKSPLMMRLGLDIPLHQEYNRYFQALLSRGGVGTLLGFCRTLTYQVDAEELGAPALDLMHDENCLMFLVEVQQPSSDPLVGRHMAELHIRLMHSLYSETPVLFDPNNLVLSLDYHQHILQSIYDWPLYIFNDDFLNQALYAKETLLLASRPENGRNDISSLYSFLPILKAYLQLRGTPELVPQFEVPVDLSAQWWDELLRQESILPNTHLPDEKIED
ncbi:hypothetical protein CVT26_012902 [Gymnopilus dilepis]|uniref:DUF6535 domain-containing protein n=1 Tax=Gymnopilus dilepis TaxID=231916 RepID=A0A409Y478_9AGAR|nr:hypothetical protein CVT26_012902 [Gymnopilus dilepis]